MRGVARLVRSERPRAVSGLSIRNCRREQSRRGLWVLRGRAAGAHSGPPTRCTLCVALAAVGTAGGVSCSKLRAHEIGTSGQRVDPLWNPCRNLGKPVELARRYFEEGADEVTFLNITGFREFPLGDLPMLEVLRQASEGVFVPLTVGGGIREFSANGRHYSALEVASEYFRSGADKVGGPGRPPLSLFRRASTLF